MVILQFLVRIDAFNAKPTADTMKQRALWPHAHMFFEGVVSRLPVVRSQSTEIANHIVLGALVEEAGTRERLWRELRGSEK